MLSWTTTTKADCASDEDDKNYGVIRNLHQSAPPSSFGGLGKEHNESATSTTDCHDGHDLTGAEILVQSAKQREDERQSSLSYILKKLEGISASLQEESVSNSYKPYMYNVQNKNSNKRKETDSNRSESVATATIQDDECFHRLQQDLRTTGMMTGAGARMLLEEKMIKGIKQTVKEDTEKETKEASSYESSSTGLIAYMYGGEGNSSPCHSPSPKEGIITAPTRVIRRLHRELKDTQRESDKGKTKTLASRCA